MDINKIIKKVCEFAVVTPADEERLRQSFNKFNEKEAFRGK